MSLSAELVCVVVVIFLLVMIKVRRRRNHYGDMIEYASMLLFVVVAVYVLVPSAKEGMRNIYNAISTALPSSWR